MTIVQPISGASDRVMAALIAGLEVEFGRGAAEGLAQRFIAAEECDFCWEARVQERWLGMYRGDLDEDFDLDRIAVLARLDGCWLVAVVIVDGDERAHGMMGKRTFGSRKTACEAFDLMR